MADLDTLRAENERLRAALMDYDRLALVISSAVRYANAAHFEAVMSAIKAGRRALSAHP